jgi:hypothetical protein
LNFYKTLTKKTELVAFEVYHYGTSFSA